MDVGHQRNDVSDYTHTYMHTIIHPFEVEYVESKNENPTEPYGQFVIQPLKPGQGITIGNALRRTLLSDLEGSAISEVRIAGVNHEFSTISGVREDVLEILLNLKEIVIKNYNTGPVIGRLKVQGPCVVTAANFDVPSNVNIVDPTQYIATICSTSILEMEFKIQNGQGYHIAEKEVDDTQMDFLQTDAVFMPVKRVNYNVEEIVSSSHNLNDKLTLEIWTNGSISPQEALNQAAAMLTELFNLLKTVNFKPEESMPVLEETQVHQMLIEELKLSVRAYNCLKRAHIHSVKDLLDYSQAELLEIKNFGQKSAEEVVAALQTRLGVNLPKEKKPKNK
jgi:DNA-directed RNA polymerase subunit alpha